MDSAEEKSTQQGKIVIHPAKLFAGIALTACAVLVILNLLLLRLVQLHNTKEGLLVEQIGMYQRALALEEAINQEVKRNLDATRSSLDFCEETKQARKEIDAACDAIVQENRQLRKNWRSCVDQLNTGSAILRECTEYLNGGKTRYTGDGEHVLLDLPAGQTLALYP